MTAPLLLLGSTGRLGQAFRRLARDGHWPGPEPVWHGRSGAVDLSWDLAEPPPRDLPEIGGIVCLAGATSAPFEANETAARAAERLAERLDVPCLALSSVAVYGSAPGPWLESAEPSPDSGYGLSKRAMERALRHATALRLGNVAGCDALFGATARGPVTLDRFADGSAPRRAMIGPLTLARALESLGRRGDLPPILNLAQPGSVAMDDLLRAAGHPFDWRPAPEAALRDTPLDTTRAETLLDLPAGSAMQLVSEARLAGWSPAS